MEMQCLSPGWRRSVPLQDGDAFLSSLGTWKEPAHGFPCLSWLVAETPVGLPLTGLLWATTGL